MPVLWRLLDGKPGHEKQTLGLAEALARHCPLQRHDIRLRRRAYALDWLRRRFPEGDDLPAPRWIIAAGHATHLALLAARRARGGRAVVLMRPSLPLAWFDLCLMPAHDRQPPAPRVFVTRGALNPLLDLGRHEAERGLILIGGPSPHYAWDSAAVRAQVTALVLARRELDWTLTTSRRTPADFLAGLPALPGLRIVPAEATPPGWLEDELARAARAWSTPDSVSMVYEALTAGCRVGLFRLAATPGSRVAAGVAALRADAYVREFDPARPAAEPPAPPAPLNEAERAARYLLEMPA